MKKRKRQFCGIVSMVIKAVAASARMYPMKVFDTAGYQGSLYEGIYLRKGFIDEIKALGTTELRVQTSFFPERAMYWTRMLRNAAAEQGIVLSTIELSSELLSDTQTTDAQRLNLSEWIRIAALSKIPQIRICIDGPKDIKDRSGILAASLMPLMGMAKQYNVILILSDGNADLTDQELIKAAKKLGYSNCRVHAKDELQGSDQFWAS